jgi:hypothetical protein
MLPMRASEALGHNRAKQEQGKQEQGKSRADVRGDADAFASRDLFANVFAALAESRMRKAKIEVQCHRSMYEPGWKK